MLRLPKQKDQCLRAQLPPVRPFLRSRTSSRSFRQLQLPLRCHNSHRTCWRRAVHLGNLLESFWTLKDSSQSLQKWQAAREAFSISTCFLDYRNIAEYVFNRFHIVVFASTVNPFFLSISKRKQIKSLNSALSAACATWNKSQLVQKFPAAGAGVAPADTTSVVLAAAGD